MRIRETAVTVWNVDMTLDIVKHCQKELDSLHWFFQRRIPTPHFGGRHQRGLRPQIRTRSRFLYNAPISKFHHPMSTRSEVIVLKSTHKQSNKQTPLKISNAFCYIDVKTFLLFYFGHFLRSLTFLKIFLRVFYFKKTFTKRYANDEKHL